jgi:hypothetical protein
MIHRLLTAAIACGFLAAAAASCPAQTTYYPHRVEHDAYGQGYYGGFGRRTNGLFPGSHTSYGNDPYVYTPSSSGMFPRYYPYRAVPNTRGYRYSLPTRAPDWGPAYDPFGYSPYVYDPYDGW